ncbi:MAG: succinylglutamate desuccinylase/aspartoacylase family protein [Gammaproteobacteria bacterium]|nr:succinylglutamate desuccinylase/aspartoacylase family protein [Gammaproteobacteria bacterium]MCB1881157.1 succinylglutamate desuccinylase/aspartoacylase family protein [Gammaproteobacteria bacterium]
MREPFVIGDARVAPRSRALVELPLPRLYTQSSLTLPVHVVHGAREGARLFVSAALHGDELNGTEIVRRLLKQPVLKQLRGTLVAVPIVNVYGVLHLSRYLPDRRDLNRSFPGSDRGSLAARLASLFMQEIVGRCSHGIDLHTAAIHRNNLPQIRANLDDDATATLAKAFGVPVLINSTLRDGSLREAAAECGIPMLLYEAGEALRFNEVAIRAGLHGIISVMRAMKMLPTLKARRRALPEPFVARSSTWVRASASGLFRKVASLGSRVRKGDVIGLIDAPFSSIETEVTAVASGIIIGCAELPLVNEGEALFHIARFEDVKEVAQHVESMQIMHTPQDDQAAILLNDEPPIV